MTACLELGRRLPAPLPGRVAEASGASSRAARPPAAAARWARWRKTGRRCTPSTRTGSQKGKGQRVDAVEASNGQRKHHTTMPGPHGSPLKSANGFRNILPMTRSERRSQRDKVALEKDRLMKRTGLAARMHRENAPRTSDGLVVPEANAAGFCSDADRFHTDVAGEEFLKRRARYEREQTAYASKREGRVRQEERRWAQLQEEKQQEDAYWSNQREIGVKDKKNKSSVPYDALTLQYAPGLDGERLRLHDDKIRYRAALRSRNLQTKGESRCGYDILNGRDKPDLRLPEEPQPQRELAEHIAKVRAEALSHK